MSATLDALRALLREDPLAAAWASACAAALLGALGWALRALLRRPTAKRFEGVRAQAEAKVWPIPAKPPIFPKWDPARMVVPLEVGGVGEAGTRTLLDRVDGDLAPRVVRKLRDFVAASIGVDAPVTITRNDRRAGWDITAGHATYTVDRLALEQLGAGEKVTRVMWYPFFCNVLNELRRANGWGPK